MRKVPDASFVATAPTSSRTPGLVEPAQDRTGRVMTPWAAPALRLAAILASGAAHAGALVLVLGAGPLGPDAGRPAEAEDRATEVALISQAAFDAMISTTPDIAAALPPAAPPVPEVPEQAQPATDAAPDAPPDASPQAIRPGDAPMAPRADTAPAAVRSPPPMSFLSARAAISDLPDSPAADQSGHVLAAFPPLVAGVAAPDPAAPALTAPQREAPPRADATPSPPPAKPPVKKRVAKAKTPQGAAPAPAAPVQPAPVQPASAQPAPGPSGLSGGARKAAMADWGGRLRARIERAKTYPPRTTAAGRVRLALSIAPSGTVLAVRIAQGSGDAALDQAAVAAVTRAGRMPKAPKGLDDASYDVTLTISFAP